LDKIIYEETKDLKVEARKVAISIMFGAGFTFLLGLFPNPLSYLLIGVAQWGMPLPWITQAIYPNAPKIFHRSEFIIDVVFWSSIFYICYYRIYKRRRKP